MRLAIAPIFAALAALATAYTQPNYNEDPTGNAITTPGLNQVVPAGKPFTIQWDPTTTGPIDLVLLRGPSTNVVPIATIAEGIANSGSYVWTPSTDLTPDVTHYGLLLVVEATGQYQYSTQFGISNPDYTGSSSSSVAATSTTSSSSSTSTVTSSNASATDSSATTLVKVTSDKKTETSANTTVTTAVSVTATNVPITTVKITQTAASSTVTIPISGAVTSHTPSSTPTPSTTSSGANRESLSIAAIAAAGAFAVLAF